MSGSWKDARFAPKGIWFDVYHRDFGTTVFPVRAHKNHDGYWVDDDYDEIVEPTHYREIGKTPDGFVFEARVT